MNKKTLKFFSLFLSILMIISSINFNFIIANAETTGEVLEIWDISATTKDSVTATLTNDGLLRISGTGEMKNFSYAGSDAPWYDINLKIKSVIIEDGITSIGNYAFYRCSNLTSISISNSVSVISTGAFGFSGIESIDIPDSVTTIKNSAFSYMPNLTSIVLPDSVTTMGIQVFYSSKKT